MNTNDIETLIERFLTDDISGKELASLSEWVSKSKNNRDILSSRMRAKAEDAGSFDAGKAFGRFRKRVVAEKGSTRPRRVFWRQAAAVAAGLAAVGVMAYQAVQVRAYKNLYVDNTVTVEAPMGSRTHVVLPDSSKVWLNSGSSLTYSYDTKEKERKVELSGEGFFEVRHDADVPFTVSSSNLSVKVLGTKFNFCDYPDDSLAEVVLTQGRIALSDKAGKELVMDPDERVLFDKATGLMARQEVSYDVDEWISGNLIFDETPLLEIVRRLERTYSVKIRIGDPALQELRFYGTFNSSMQDISEVLQSLSATGKFRYRKEHNVITLY